MLYLNGELVTKDKETTKSAYAEVEDFKKNEWRTFRESVTFVAAKQPTKNTTGWLEPYPVETIPFKDIANGPNGAEEWQYSPTLARKNPTTGRLILPAQSRRHFMKQSWTIQKSNVDLLFFLLKKCSFVKRGIIYMEDKAGAAAKEVVARSKEGDMKFFIYSDHSPISVKSTGDESRLRQLALSFGVGHALNEDILSFAEVQLALENQLVRNEENPNKKAEEGIGAFLEACQENGEFMEARAKIYSALASGGIRFEVSDSTFKFADGRTLASVPMNQKDRKESYLADLFIADAKKYDGFVNAVFGEKIEITKAEIEQAKNDMTKLRSYAKLKGLSAYQKGKDQLYNELIELFQK